MASRLLLFHLFGMFVTAFAGQDIDQAQQSVNNKNKHVSLKAYEPIKLDDKLPEDLEIKEIIAPYRIKLRNMVSRQIAQVNEPIELAGAEDSSLGPFLAKLLLDEANYFARKYQYPSVDIGFMGFHGVRKTRLVGGISIADLYELMPFENTLNIVALSGSNLRKLAEYFLKDRFLHPIFGMEIWIKNTKIQKVLLSGHNLRMDKTYYVAVPSYWAEGGDGMNFFTQGLAIDTKIKVRDIFTKHLASMQNINRSKLPKLSVHRS